MTCPHDNISLPTTSDPDTVCADCGAILNQGQIPKSTVDTTGSKVQPVNNQQGAKTMSKTTEFATICGKTIQIDLSGVGHNWQPLPVDDMSEDLEDLLAAEILDGGEYGRVTIGGVHYRWQ